MIKTARGVKVFKCLKRTILINCFILIAVANIGFYIQPNVFPRLVIIKILVVVSSGLQLLSFAFLMIWKIILDHKESRAAREYLIELRNYENLSRVIPEGRNPTNSYMFTLV